MQGGTFESWFYVTSTGRTNVNTATDVELEAVNGIGEETVRRILTERDNRAFADLNDFLARVALPGSYRDRIINNIIVE